MKKRILQVVRTDLFKTSAFNGIANIIKILTGLVSNKIIAIYLGPSGLALLGQFYNFTNIITNIANIGLPQGITKYIAEFHDSDQQRKRVLSTGFYLIILSTFLTSFVLFIFRNKFSELIFNTEEYAFVFVVLAGTLLFFALNTFCISVLNGFKEFKKIIITNILSSLFGLGIAIVAVIKFGVKGAFVGYILSQTLVFVITLNWVIRSDWFKIKIFISHFSKDTILKLGRYTLMTFSTVFASSFILLQIRTYIINAVSIEDAGYWQGINRICVLYIMFITTTLTIYYLPRLSEIKKVKELRHEIFKTYKLIMPLIILSSVLIYILRDLIINILYTDSFSEMRNLFLFQLFGNVLKIASFLLSYLMVAKAMTKVYIISEIAFGILYYLTTMLFIKRFGIIGATYAYSLTYFIYLLFVVWLFRDLVLNKFDNNGITDDTK